MKVIAIPVLCLALYACGSKKNADTNSNTNTSSDVTLSEDVTQVSTGDTPFPENDTSSAEETSEPDAAGSDTTPPGLCPCDDLNPCTTDTCVSGTCKYEPIQTMNCQPAISVSTPPRGASFGFLGEKVTVEGVVSSPAGGISEITLNGAPLQVEANGLFGTKQMPVHGINPLVLRAVDKTGNVATSVQSYLTAPVFYPTTQGLLDSALIPNGIVLAMGAEVWDDDDLTDIDDAATLVHLVLAGLDIKSLVPNPIQPGEDDGILWCKDWEITVKGVEYNVESIDLDLMQDGLFMSAKFSDFWFSFDAESPNFACPDAKGGIASAKEVSLTGMVKITLLSKGHVGINFEQVEAVLTNPNVEVEAGAGSFVAWMLKWFKGTFKSYLESAFATLADEKVAPVVQNYFNAYSDYATTFKIPPIPPLDKEVAVTVRGQANNILITPDHCEISLGISATSPTTIPGLKSPGAVARKGCFSGVEPPLVLPTGYPVALGVHMDVINQAAFAAWWGGLLHTKIDTETVKELLGNVAIKGVDVVLSPLLPPVVTNCTEDGTSELQLGDFGVELQFMIDGQPALVKSYATANFTVDVQVASSKVGSIDLSLGVVKLNLLEFQVTKVTGAIDGTELFLQTLMQEVVAKMVVNIFSEGFMHSFPVPTVDVGSVVPGIPEGSFLTIVPSSKTVVDGYVIATGKIMAQ